jgi:hypothetical protein
LKIASSKGIFQTFVHDYFLRDRKDLIKQIKRRTGIVVKKKKTLFEQVTELKQRDQVHKQRIEELEISDMQKGIYINEMEAHLRQLREERDALASENQRFMLMLSAKDYGGPAPMHHAYMNRGAPRAQAPPPPQQWSNQGAAQMHQPNSSGMFEPVSGPSRFDSQQPPMGHYDQNFDWLPRPN